MRFSLRHTLIVTLAFSAAAFASEDGQAGPVHVDYWQTGFTVVVFLLLVAILGKFAFKPIMKGLNDREAFITNALRDADEA
ncbi:MAG: ATP synthase F0 subunit B, partial [Planctomycetes bacterium]|nr:ATP synthase F0 subunit B [Planctomycetota bacterium]